MIATLNRKDKIRIFIVILIAIIGGVIVDGYIDNQKTVITFSCISGTDICWNATEYKNKFQIHNHIYYEPYNFTPDINIEGQDSIEN